eukprot:365347-Chlamydomonas_euryale.AAC.15
MAPRQGPSAAAAHPPPTTLYTTACVESADVGIANMPWSRGFIPHRGPTNTLPTITFIPTLGTAEGTSYGLVVSTPQSRAAARSSFRQSARSSDPSRRTDLRRAGRDPVPPASSRVSRHSSWPPAVSQLRWVTSRGGRTGRHWPINGTAAAPARAPGSRRLRTVELRSRTYARAGPDAAVAHQVDVSRQGLVTSGQAGSPPTCYQSRRADLRPRTRTIARSKRRGDAAGVASVVIIALLIVGLVVCGWSLVSSQKQVLQLSIQVEDLEKRILIANVRTCPSAHASMPHGLSIACIVHVPACLHAYMCAMETCNCMRRHGTDCPLICQLVCVQSAAESNLAKYNHVTKQFHQLNKASMESGRQQIEKDTELQAVKNQVSCDICIACVLPGHAHMCPPNVFL